MDTPFDIFDSKHMVLAECVGLRLRSVLLQAPRPIVIDEILRAETQRVLDKQKVEYPHNHAVLVELIERDGKPAITINIGGTELYAIEDPVYT